MKILSIEDDALNRRVVHDMLMVAGVAMDEADCAETGLRMIDATLYDVILMDLRMPGMDGLEAISLIRRRPDAKSRLPIIIITADAAENLRAICIAQGADELLLKPVAMEDLFDAIGQVIATRSTGSTLLI